MEEEYDDDDDCDQSLEEDDGDYCAKGVEEEVHDRIKDDFISKDVDVNKDSGTDPEEEDEVDDEDVWRRVKATF